MEKKLFLFTDEGEKLEITLSPKEHGRFIKFNENFQLESFLDGESNTILGGKVAKKDRTCRFCGKSYPDTTFKKEAHVITQQLNRAKPTSSFECDQCNDNFSKHEGDFGHFFLIERALYGHKKKKGNPKYKSSSGTEISKVIDFDLFNNIDSKRTKFQEFIKQRDATLISIIQDEEENEVKINANSIKIKLKRKPFVPLNVYKVFLKIALSLIDEKELGDYSMLLKLLNSNYIVKNNEEFTAKEITLFTYELPVYKNVFPYPLACLYKQIVSNSSIVSKTLILYFGNKIYQIPLLSDINIKRMMNKQTVDFIRISPFINPYFSKEMFENQLFCDWLKNVRYRSFNLYKTRLVTDDFQEIELSQESDFVTL